MIAVVSDFIRNNVFVFLILKCRPDNLLESALIWSYHIQRQKHNVVIPIYGKFSKWIVEAMLLATTSISSLITKVKGLLWWVMKLIIYKLKSKVLNEFLFWLKNIFYKNILKPIVVREKVVCTIDRNCFLSTTTTPTPSKKKKNGEKDKEKCLCHCQTLKISIGSEYILYLL